MGAQPLHSLEVELYCDDHPPERRELRIGLRSVTVDQPPAPDRGTLFQIVVNGVPFFAKGGNWVPVSLTPHPVPVALLDRQVARAVEAEFNFLRVWGGGDYETEEFYDRCDELGILVWQDLVFACSRYPMRVEWYRELVEAEVRHQVRRLAKHPSLAIWCGNNENAWIGQGPGFPGPLVPAVDGIDVNEYRADHAWFETEGVELAAAEDPTRLFWPSSPWSPTDADHNAGHEGDQHPWSIGFTDVDFRKYREMDDRFPNEGGLLGPSSLPAVLECLPEGQRHYGSFAWKTHDNEMATRFAVKAYEEQLLEWVGRDIGSLSLEEYVYWSGLLHGEGLTEYVDNFRRRATTSAAVFWMFNDCWPTVRSWTIVDHHGRRTPSFHPVRRAFAPIRVGIVDVSDPTGGGARVWVRNDTQAAIALELEAGTMSFAGAVDTERTRVEVPARSVREVRDLDAPSGDPYDSAHVAVLRDHGDRRLAQPPAPGPFRRPVAAARRGPGQARAIGRWWPRGGLRVRCLRPGRRSGPRRRRRPRRQLLRPLPRCAAPDAVDSGRAAGCPLHGQRGRSAHRVDLVARGVISDVDVRGPLRAAGGRPGSGRARGGARLGPQVSAAVLGRHRRGPAARGGPRSRKPNVLVDGHAAGGRRTSCACRRLRGGGR